MKEGLLFDKKSLRLVSGKTKNFGELARDCVAFANAKGGHIYIGIEDDADMPLADQVITKDLPEVVVKRINELTINVCVQADIKVADNGGEYIDLHILQSVSSVASTTNGIYSMRDGDSCRNLLPDELIRLLTDKSAYCWETKVTQKIPWNQCDSAKLASFIQDIEQSPRVSAFVKDMNVEEKLSYYMMIDDSQLMTNLGILWIGTRQQRARLLYSPIVQYIKYDANESKVNKIMWDDYVMNPKELINSIWQNIPDWRESTEISEGLWRREVPAYDEVVVREVICNAMVHRPYTTKGDVFINIYPDRLVVRNPGQLPFGVTPTNILQKTEKRNIHLAKVFYDLRLMEAEGSGWDLMYETLLSVGKMPPVIIEGDDYVEVTVGRNIVNKEALRIVDYVNSTYSLKQKALIALGIIIQATKISSVELSKSLQLTNEDRLRGYLDPLVDNKIVISSGRGKGTRYEVNPDITTMLKTNIRTSLKTIEPYRLRALIIEDLRHHKGSLLSEMAERLPDVDFKQMQTMVRNMAKSGELITNGGRKYCRYSLPKE